MTLVNSVDLLLSKPGDDIRTDQKSPELLDAVEKAEVTNPRQFFGNNMRRSRSFSHQEGSADAQTAVALETEVTTGNKFSRARNRKKSRRLTLVQACAQSNEGSPSISVTETTDPDPSKQGSTSNDENATKDNNDRLLSPPADQKERKISRIFWMLQSMQQTFLQNLNPMAHYTSSESAESTNPPPVVTKPPAQPTYPTVRPTTSFVSPTMIPEEAHPVKFPDRLPPHLRSLNGLGQSAQSVTSFSNVPLKNPIHDRLNRIGSINSWAGSEYSESSLLSSSTLSSNPPPLVHPVPYHKDGWTSLFIVGSSMYAQLLIVICIVSVLSEVVTHNVPLQYYEASYLWYGSLSVDKLLYGFFTYLYAVSILFFLYVFGYLLRSNNRKIKKLKQRRISKWKARQAKNMTSVAVENELPNINPNESSVIRRNSREEENEKNADTTVWFPSTSLPGLQTMITEETTKTPVTFTPSSTSSTRRIKKMKVSENEHSHGSFFLRAGAVAFGLGTMIYDGLEFGAFLEIPPDSPCHALLRGVNPVLHATFVFLQMYFIFVSARLNIHKFKAVARFGLMHCLATNVCVWVRTLVRESLKEINGHYQGSGKHLTDEHHDTLSDLFNKSKDHPSLWELTGNVSCGRRILLGDVIMDAAPFLYPFLIEYSLIGAAVLYVLWAHIGLNPRYIGDENEDESREKSHLRVDCLGASKGLFVGLFLLAASLLCLVLFFVFAPQKEFRLLGLVLADAAHCALLLVSLVAMAIGVYRVQDLTFHAEHTEELGNLLLRVSALGIFAYSVFSMIAGALSPWTDEPPLLVLINGLLSVVQVTAQMLFISDMSRRRITTPEQDRTKPGRQTVTFLLITNLTLWVVYTFEMQKVEANPVQLNFYGFLPWAVVQRITLPLCIFYRFHSAIVFAEIWKNTYRFS